MTSSNADNRESAKGRSQKLAEQPSRRRTLAIAAILSATFIAYAPTLAFGYIYDDYYLIIANESLRSWRYLPVYFTGHIWSFIFPNGRANSYRPLLLLWLRLNYFVFQLHPWGWHLTIVMAHVAATYLVYRLCLRLTPSAWTSAAAALIFGLHPVHVETIAEAAWADQPLCTLFVMATVLAWWRARESSRKIRWQVASLGFCGAALFSKESGMMLPVLVAALEWIYGKPGGGEGMPEEGGRGLRARARAALEATVPYCFVVLAYLWARLLAMKTFSYLLKPLSVAQVLLTIPSILVSYLRLLVWPVNLSCYYDTAYISAFTWHDVGRPLAVLAGTLAVVVFWYGRARRAAPENARAIAFAFLWMVVTILPVLNFRLLPDSEFLHDRYLYLPSVGFCILVGMALRQGFAALPQSLRKPLVQVPATLALPLILGLAVIRQSPYWVDDLILYSHAYQVAPHNVCATTDLASALFNRGKIAAAERLYKQALAMNPDYWPALVNMGYLEYGQKRYQEAAQYLLRASTLEPSDGDTLAYLAMTLLHLGRPNEAEGAARLAIMMNPTGKNYSLVLGRALEAEGKLQEARQEVASVVKSEPHNTQAQALLKEIDGYITHTSEKTPVNPPPIGKATPFE